MGVPKTTLYEYCMQHPDVKHLLDEYSTENQKTAYEIGAKTGSTKVKWHCNVHNYTWEDFPANRVRYPIPPCCSGKVATKGNSLAALYPEITKDFSKELNVGIDPYNLLPNSHVRVTWKCHKCGHIWSTACGSRIRRLTGCPNCSSR